MKRAVIAVVFIGFAAGFFGTWALVKSCADYSEKEKAKKEAREAEYGSLILSEKEMDYWTEVYSAAVRRGVWYPARMANDAVIELRKITEAKNEQ